MKLPRSFLLAAGFVSSTGLVAASADAQGMRRIVVTPYAGVFVPASRVAELKPALPGVQSAIGIRQQNALALGANASYWFNGFAGVELGGAWAFSNTRASFGLTSQVPGFSLSRNESARVLMGSAKLMVNLMRVTERSALRLGVGPAIINRGGSAFRADDNGEFSGLTDIGGAISLCSRLPLTDFLSLRVRAENYLYSSKLKYRDFSTNEEFSFGSKLQNDFIFSAGLQMVWWR
jgi:hypothetical protein